MIVQLALPSSSADGHLCCFYSAPVDICFCAGITSVFLTYISMSEIASLWSLLYNINSKSWTLIIQYFKDFFFNFMHLSGVHRGAAAHEDQKKESEPLEWELQASASCLIWVPRTKFWCSEEKQYLPLASASPLLFTFPVSVLRDSTFLTHWCSVLLTKAMLVDVLFVLLVGH